MRIGWFNQGNTGVSGHHGGAWLLGWQPAFDREREGKGSPVVSAPPEAQADPTVQAAVAASAATRPLNAAVHQFQGKAGCWPVHAATLTAWQPPGAAGPAPPGGGPTWGRRRRPPLNSAGPYCVPQIDLCCWIVVYGCWSCFAQHSARCLKSSAQLEVSLQSGGRPTTVVPPSVPTLGHSLACSVRSATR